IERNRLPKIIDTFFNPVESELRCVLAAFQVELVGFGAWCVAGRGLAPPRVAPTWAPICGKFLCEFFFYLLEVFKPLPRFLAPITGDFRWRPPVRQRLPIHRRGGSLVR